MKIDLIEYTGKNDGEWAAADLLIFTKSTRLNMTPGLYSKIKELPIEEKLKELEYMSNTIPSSWEFVDYVFCISNVTRAFTHQFVRTRSGSYAQQTMRVLNVEGFDYGTGPSIDCHDYLKYQYDKMMTAINNLYSWLIDNGAEIQDARGILPTNIHTNIVAKFNLRTMAEMASKRSSPRTQGEYRDVLDMMIDEILKVHPWAALFLKNKKIDAAKQLDDFINNIYEKLSDAEGIPNKADVLKLVDILRG